MLKRKEIEAFKENYFMQRKINHGAISVFSNDLKRGKERFRRFQKTNTYNIHQFDSKDYQKRSRHIESTKMITAVEMSTD